MSELQPFNTDAILGGQNPPPLNDAVLGGVAGTKRKIVHEWGLSEELVDRFSFETVTLNDRAEIIERKQKEAFCYTVDINGVPLEMVYIPAGSFLMGGSSEWFPNSDVEEPIHLVTLKSFFMAKYPTTQAQYQAIMGNNPSEFKGDDRHPVEKVSWDNAIKFCHQLSELTNKHFSLPSESQWEYTCRAGSNTLFYCGQKINADLVNYIGCDRFDETNREDVRNRFQGKTTCVGKYPPNPWGLYDMHGNVWEWCLDSQHKNYIGAPIDGSAWTNADEKNLYSHPVRGGAWNDFSWQCMSYKRMFADNHYQTPHNGFRACMLLQFDR